MKTDDPVQNKKITFDPPLKLSSELVYTVLICIFTMIVGNGITYTIIRNSD